ARRGAFPGGRSPVPLISAASLRFGRVASPAWPSVAGPLSSMLTCVDAWSIRSRFETSDLRPDESTTKHRTDQSGTGSDLKPVDLPSLTLAVPLRGLLVSTRLRRLVKTRQAPPPPPPGPGAQGHGLGSLATAGIATGSRWPHAARRPIIHRAPQRS